MTEIRTGIDPVTMEPAVVEPIKLDIACGQNKQEGFVGIDIANTNDADLVHDLNVYPWPLLDDSVEEAFCSHYIEHIPLTVTTDNRGYRHPEGERDALMTFMNELYRVMCDDAQVRFVYPHSRSDRAFQDPTHRRFIPEATWHYWSREWREQNKLDHYPIECDFEVRQLFYSGFSGEWQHRSEQARAFALAHYWNVAGDVVVDLRCRKG